MTLRKRLYLLAGLNVVLTLILGIIGFYGLKHLDPATSPLVRQMTAIRNAMQVDMMHDAFRSDVLRSLLISLSGNSQFGDKEEVSQDLKDHVETMKSALEENKQLDLGEAVSKIIAETEAPVTEYQKIANEVSNTAFEDFDKASSKYPEFQEIFSRLEGVLEESASKIEKESEATLKEQVEYAQSLRSTLVAISILAFIVGLGVSTWMIRSLVKEMAVFLGDLGKNSLDVRTQAQVMTQASVDLSASSTEQAASVQESVAAVSEMLSMLSQSSDFATQSLVAAKEMNQKTGDGNRIMAKLVSSVSSIQQANSQLMEMANIIQEISSKTAVINDIVFKTQLLSFNASIEAARAGQHGRGFAVVAEEVGNLAEMSGTSAREIQTLLEDSRKQVASIVESVQRRVTEGEQVSGEAVSIFNQIANESQNISSFIQRINEATKEQETGVQQISTAMTQVGSSAQKNNQSAIETSQSAKKLFDQSNGLRRVVEGLEGLIFGGSSQSKESKKVKTKASTQIIEADKSDLIEHSFETPKILQNGIRHSTNGHHKLADDESFRPYNA